MADSMERLHARYLWISEAGCWHPSDRLLLS